MSASHPARIRRLTGTFSAFGLVLAMVSPAAAQERVLDGGVHYLRMGGGPEWTESAVHPHARELSIQFTAPEESAAEQTISLRQQGVKQRWRILLNEQEVGVLLQDENAMVTHWAIPPRGVVTGTNTLRITPADTLVDDIEIEQIVLHERPRSELLAEAALDLEVVDESGAAVPARFTIVDERGALQQIGTESDSRLAIRPGFVYTGNGRASIELPAGNYRIYAGRGFEYGVDSADVVLQAGDRAASTFRIQREVPTEGWVSVDTHVHTYTHSGHGDATMEERALTIAGEGIELPILTDHNVHIDLGPVAEAMGVRGHFTPVVGNELTTAVGHFNLFPLTEATPVPSPMVADWAEAARAIAATPGVQGIVLNHARDIHAGFRPFGPARHIAIAGMSLDGWVPPANAMEVVNSGSQQTEPMQLFEDWLGMLNGGHLLTPVGGSDSHDVARYIVGQARTYIRTGDGDPGRIDVDEAMERFRAGAVMVSFGLLAELSVDGRYGPGDLVAPRDEVEVAVRVLGPGWTRAERVTLYANGTPIRTAAVADGGVQGVKWTGAWTIPRPAHDVHLVAIAEGPDPERVFWPIAKPYQPMSPETDPRVIGLSGAVWIDADGDGERTSAHDYATRLLAAAGGDHAALMGALALYDEAVAVQVAALLLARGIVPTSADLGELLRDAAPATTRGFRIFAEAWSAAESARRGAVP